MDDYTGGGGSPSPGRNGANSEFDVDNEFTVGLNMEIITDQNDIQQNTEKREPVLYGNYDKGPFLVILHKGSGTERSTSLHPLAIGKVLHKSKVSGVTKITKKGLNLLMQLDMKR